MFKEASNHVAPVMQNDIAKQDERWEIRETHATRINDIYGRINSIEYLCFASVLYSASHAATSMQQSAFFACCYIVSVIKNNLLHQSIQLLKNNS
jgi:hypothetical protein